MDPQKLPVAVLLALGLSGCGEKEVDSGPCLSIAHTGEDTGDTAGPCLSPADDTSEESAAAAEAAPAPPAVQERGAVLEGLLRSDTLPADVAAELGPKTERVSTDKKRFASPPMPVAPRHPSPLK